MLVLQQRDKGNMLTSDLVLAQLMFVSGTKNKGYPQSTIKKNKTMPKPLPQK
jgi:hypothetical protein